MTQVVCPYCGAFLAEAPEHVTDVEQCAKRYRPGTTVMYIPLEAKGSRKHKACATGKVVSFDGTHVMIKFEKLVPGLPREGDFQKAEPKDLVYL